MRYQKAACSTIRRLRYEHFRIDYGTERTGVRNRLIESDRLRRRAEIRLLQRIYSLRVAILN